MARARFKTKLSRAQKRKNVLVFIVVLLCCYAFTLGFGHAIDIFEGWTSLEMYILALAATLFILIMLIFPMMLAAVALGIQMGKAKRVRDNVTFVPAQNLDYYREALGGLNPSIVSLLIDLDLYGRKDVAATLLRMQNKKLIAFQDDGRIMVLWQNAINSDISEYELLNAIKNGRINSKSALRSWRQRRFEEAKHRGYIQQRKADMKKNYRYLCVALVSMLVVLALWGAFLASDIMKTNPVLGMLFLLPIGILIFVPWYLAIREAVYWKRGDILWERTPLGNEMAEKIAGLSRFIHEFSLLSEANKEQAALWDDYLVYAVVLEENDKIVKDICRNQKINLRSFGGLK